MPGGARPAEQDAPIDFTRQVRPILSDHCFACHGPDAEGRKAGLLLAEFETATANRDSGGRAITPGDPERSELWKRITDPDDPMPPREAHNPLNAEEIELLRKWIEQGASYAPHWAYVPPRRDTRS